MSITEKLGKMGIPGFRSGKKWKMVLASVVYLFIILALVSPSSNNNRQTSASTIVEPTVATQKATGPMSTVAPVSTVTPIATETERSIVIKYSAKKVNSVSEYSKPKAGNILMVVTMTIENHGYDSINTNPNYFSVISNNIKHDYSPDTFLLSDKLDTVDILDGGTAKGSIAFEVPSGIVDFKLQYKSFTNYNVIYNAE